MAYKFQLGDARVSGSLVQTSGSILVRDNIQSAQTSEAVEILMDDNLATAFVVKEGSNEYFKINTANSNGEFVHLMKPIQMGGTSFIGFNGMDSFINGTDSDNLVIDAMTTTKFKIGSADRVTVTDLSLSCSVGVSASTMNLLDASGIAGKGLENSAGKLRGTVSGLSQINAAGVAGGDQIYVFDADSSGEQKKMDLSDLQTAFNPGGQLALTFTTDTNTDVDVSVANLKTRLASDLGAVTIGDSNDVITIGNKLVVTGDLEVKGTNFIVQSTTINYTGSIQFEGTGADNDFETLLGVVNPTADTEIKLPALDAATDYGVAVLKGSLGSAEGVITPTEFLNLDGNLTPNSRTGGAALVDTDGFLCNNGGTMEQVRLDSLKSYINTGTAVLSVTSSTNNMPLQFEQVNLVPNRTGPGQSVTLTLPTNSDSNIGKQMLIKTSQLNGGAVVTLTTPGSTKVDDEDTIVIESSQAAIRIIMVAANDYRIF